MCRWMLCTSRTSQATCSPHKWACKRAFGSSTWAATSSNRAAKSDPHLELVGSPVAGQGSVEAVGQEPVLMGALSLGDGLIGEHPGPRRIPGVGPAAGQRAGQAGPVGIVDGPGPQVIQLGRQPARIGAINVHRSRAQGGSSPAGQVALRPGSVDRLLVEAAGLGTPTGQPQGVGLVEQLVEAYRDGHRTDGRFGAQGRISFTALACSRCLASSQSPVQ